MMRRVGVVALALLLLLTTADDLVAQDTTLAQGGIYQRPFIAASNRTAIGGYVEANTSWSRTEGISEGPSSELRRFNIFLYSAMGRRLRFTSELEFEHGTEEIKIETALVDFVVSPSLVFRAGVLLPPIGAFNVNHDGPRYEFVERPLVSTEIIPATLSEAGAGIHGRLAPGGRGGGQGGGLTLSYDAYFTNGLDDRVVLNETGRTSLTHGKGESLFAEDQNGSPAFSGRFAARARGLGEFGLSHYRGIYNVWKLEGEEVDDARWLSLTAFDVQTDMGPVALRGEVALATIDVPLDLGEVHGDRQWGFYLDAVMPVWHPRIRALTDPVVNMALRVERVDFNVGEFSSTGARRFDEVSAVSLGASLRPVPETVFRLNYRLEWHRDLVGNPTERTAGIQVGVATYF
jgi:hypothetical protein